MIRPPVLVLTAAISKSSACVLFKFLSCFSESLNLASGARRQVPLPEHGASRIKRSKSLSESAIISVSSIFVAFSRAKKCMIVVASEIFRDKKAAVKAPAFAEFYKRCEEKRDGRCCVKLFGEGGII